MKKLLKKVSECRNELFKILGVIAGFFFIALLVENFPLISEHSGSVDFAVGLVSTVISIITWFSVSKLVNGRKTIIKDSSPDEGSGVVLIVDVGGRGISSQIIDFFDNKSKVNEHYKEVTNGKFRLNDSYKFVSDAARTDLDQCDIKSIIGKGSDDTLKGVFLLQKSNVGKFLELSYGTMPAKDSKEIMTFIDSFTDTLNRVESFIAGQGITTLFLFCSAPLVIQGLVQSKFKNRFKCHMFHFANGNYIYAYTYGNEPDPECYELMI